MKIDLSSDQVGIEVSSVECIEPKNMILVPGSMTKFPKSQAPEKVPNLLEMADMMSS